MGNAETKAPVLMPRKLADDMLNAVLWYRHSPFKRKITFRGKDPKIDLHRLIIDYSNILMAADGYYSLTAGERSQLKGLISENSEKEGRE